MQHRLLRKGRALRLLVCLRLLHDRDLRLRRLPLLPRRRLLLREVASVASLRD